jgi:Oxysterol-binding protein
VATFLRGTNHQKVSKTPNIPSQKKPLITEELEEELKEAAGSSSEEPLETRDVLPFFKNPKIKISIWSIIKDSIGKDLSKITVPVYFNGPLSLL